MTAPRFRRLSPPGVAALSVWRLIAQEEELSRLLGRGSLPAPDRPTVCGVPAEDGAALDEGVLWVRGTGSAGVVAELHLHGGRGVAAAWRARLAGSGWLEEAPPDSADQARFLEARGPWNARAAAAVLDGAFEAELARARACGGAQGRRRLAELAARADWARLLESPPEIVLAGPPNAGKSTLFNAWLREERVTVSPHRGTTRDSVEAGILLGVGEHALEARLVDTAGLWDPEEALDRAAVAVARGRLARAWRVVWVFDAAHAPEPELLAAARASPATHPRLLHRTDRVAAWEPRDAGWLRGSVLRDGPGCIAELERALLRPLGPPPPPGALLPLGDARRRAVEQALRAAAQD